jgi:hypothetical protein
MLRENRFEKDQAKLQIIYDRFKQMSSSDLLMNKRRCSDLYNSYIGRYGWHCTPVGQHYELLREGL